MRARSTAASVCPDAHEHAARCGRAAGTRARAATGRAACSRGRAPRARSRRGRPPRCRWWCRSRASIDTHIAVSRRDELSLTSSGISSRSSRSGVMRQADQAAPVAGHEVDRLGRDGGGRHRQVAFVLAVLVVDDDDHPPGADGLDGVVDRGERPLAAGPLGDAHLGLGHGASVPLGRAGHVFPNHIALEVHLRAGPKVSQDVCAHVNGMIMTSNRASASAATVRLTPLTATEPLGTNRAPSRSGTSTPASGPRRRRARRARSRWRPHAPGRNGRRTGCRRASPARG